MIVGDIVHYEDNAGFLHECKIVEIIDWIWVVKYQRKINRKRPIYMLEYEGCNPFAVTDTDRIKIGSLEKYSS